MTESLHCFRPSLFRFSPTSPVFQPKFPVCVYVPYPCVCVISVCFPICHDPGCASPLLPNFALSPLTTTRIKSLRLPAPSHSMMISNRSSPSVVDSNAFLCHFPRSLSHTLALLRIVPTLVSRSPFSSLHFYRLADDYCMYNLCDTRPLLCNRCLPLLPEKNSLSSPYAPVHRFLASPVIKISRCFYPSNTVRTPLIMDITP